MSKTKIKGEGVFKKAFEAFKAQAEKFSETLAEFKEVVEEKREWTDERSEKWHEVEENEQFNDYLSQVQQFIDTTESLLNEIELEEFPTNEI